MTRRFAPVARSLAALLVAVVLIPSLAACGSREGPTADLTTAAPPMDERNPRLAATAAPAASSTITILQPVVLTHISTPTATATATAPPGATATATTTPTAGPSPTQVPSVPNEWSQLAGGPQRTGYVPVELSTNWRFKWVWNGPVNGGDGGPASNHRALPKGAQPVVGDGRLYVGHSDGTVWAINAATGADAWSRSVGGQVLDTGAYDPATRSVFFGSTNGRLYKLNANNGAVLGEFNAGGQIVSAPLLVGNTVFIGSTSGNFYAVDTTTMQQRWVYNAGGALRASPAYTSRYEGLVIFTSEDKFVHAVKAQTGQRHWRVAVNSGQDPQRGNVRFPDTYPVVSEVNDVVIIRSYFNWDLTWRDPAGAPSTVEEIRTFLSNPANANFQSFFVLELSNGNPRFVAPVLAGAIGNGDDYYSTPPQAVVKRLNDGSEVAYLLWRTRQACRISSCDGREDTTIGEMNLTTGNIRFVQDYKNEGMMRMPTDEQSPLSMAGNDLFYSHWMLQGAIRITDRSPSLGGSYANPIRSIELTPITNTLAAGSCPDRNVAQRRCPRGMAVPPNDNGEGEGFVVDPGFYVYYNDRRIYDRIYTPPVRSTVISGTTIYWKTVDGAIIALEAAP